MKAIFAVSALAAAISAQAIAADTEATTTFSGEVAYSSTFELDTPNRSMGMDGDSLSMEIDVKNGGFSGTISFNEEGDDDDGNDLAKIEDEISVSDLQYTEGAILFGQGIGSIMTTAGAVGNMDSTMDYDAADGFRYTSDFGLTVQAEAGDDDWDEDGDTADQATDFGLAAAYMTDLDVAAVTVEAQYREVNKAAGEEDTMTFPYVGAKVVASPADMVTVTGALSYGQAGVQKYNEDADAIVAYGVKADVTVMEGVTAAAYYSTTDTNNEVGVSASATFAPLTVTASHKQMLEAETSETEVTAALSQDFEVADGVVANAHAEATFVPDTDVDWSAGANVTYAISDMLSAYAGYEVDNAGDGTEAIAKLTYTTEGGASLSAVYTNRNDVFLNADDETDPQNDVVLKASYSF
jgi:hypothetical protein